MPQTPVPTPVGNIFNIDLRNDLLAGNVEHPLEIYRAITLNNSCNYVLIADTTIELSQMEVPQEYVDAGYVVFGLQTVAVYCRPNYQSVDFPDNPEFNNI